MVDEIMFLDLPREEREQVMRDNCDQIIERSYTKKFDQEEINARRAEYADVGIQVAELENSLRRSVPTTKAESSHSWSV